MTVFKIHAKSQFLELNKLYHKLKQDALHPWISNVKFKTFH